MTEDSAWSTFSATLTTTDAIEAYGGFQFSRAELEEFADHFNESGLSLSQNHDSTQRVRTRNVRVEVVARDDGEYELTGNGEVHPEDEHLLELHRGLSVTTTRPLEGQEHEPTDVGILIAANPAWFPDSAIEEAQILLSEVVSAGGVRLYEFGHDPDPNIVVRLTMSALSAVGGPKLWLALKVLWAARRLIPGREAVPTQINIQLEDGDRSAVAQVKTTKERTARQALKTFDRAAERLFDSPSETPIMLWNEAEGRWDNVSD